MKFIYVILLAALLSACNQGSEESQSVQTKLQDSKDRTKYTEVYDNGQIKVQGWLQNDKRVGLWMAFYDNGVRWSEDEYRDGMKEGKSITYYPNGIIRYRGHFIADKEAGTWQFYDDSGKLIREKDFNK